MENLGDQLFGTTVFYSKFGSSCSPNTQKESNPQKAIIKHSFVSTVTNCFTEQNRNCRNSLNFLNVKQRSYCPTECAQTSSGQRDEPGTWFLKRSRGKKSACFLTLASRILDSNASAEGAYYKKCFRVLLGNPHCNNPE